TGAVASALPAVFNVAVAVKVSAPACACASVAPARDTATARQALIVVCRRIITVSSHISVWLGPRDPPCELKLRVRMRRLLYWPRRRADRAFQPRTDRR